MSYIVNRNIESLEEIINEVPTEYNILVCRNKGLRSLRGIDRLPQITRLHVDNNQITSLQGIIGSNVAYLSIENNQITSLEYITGSNITDLYISNNQITSLKHIVGSNVIHLSIDNNPCYNEFVELENSIEKVKERYSFLDVKDPGFE